MGPASGRLTGPEYLSAASLCVAAGIVDAFGFLLSGVFAANMTGNTVLLGIAVGQGMPRWHLERAAAPLAFFVGAITGRALLIGSQATPTRPLVAEAFIMSACVALPAAHQVTAMAAAMGVQAVAITRFAGVAASTVVVTSTIARLGEATVERFFIREPARRTSGGSRAAALWGVTWFSYALGAAAAALLPLGNAWLVLAAFLVLLTAVLRHLRGAAHQP